MEEQNVEDADSAAESRLARKLANLGMALGSYYTVWRIQSEYITTFDAHEKEVPNSDERSKFFCDFAI